MMWPDPNALEMLRDLRSMSCAGHIFYMSRHCLFEQLIYFTLTKSEWTSEWTVHIKGKVHLKMKFLSLRSVVPLRSMQDQKSLGFHQKYLNLWRWTKVLRLWNDMRVIINDTFFTFGWTILLRAEQYIVVQKKNKSIGLRLFLINR